LLDNKGVLAEMVDKSGAHSTDLQHPEDVHSLCAKCADAADRWAVVADRLWAATPEYKKHPKVNKNIWKVNN